MGIMLPENDHVMELADAVKLQASWLAVASPTHELAKDGCAVLPGGAVLKDNTLHNAFIEGALVIIHTL